MPRQIITKTLIAAQRPKAIPYDLWDARIPKLLLRVEPSGTMSFFLQERRAKRTRLGPVSIGIDTAREIAVQVLGGLARGNDAMGTLAKLKKLTFRRFVDEEYAPWATQHLKSAVKALQRLRSTFSDFHPLLLREITPGRFEKFRTSRLAEGKKRRTANRDLDDIRGVLSKAVQWGHIDANPLATVRKLKTDRLGIVRYLKADEEVRLFERLDARETEIRAARYRSNEWRKIRGYSLFPTFHNHTYADHLRPMVIVSLHTGLRQGELFDLTWDRVDLELKRITVFGDKAKSNQSRHIPINESCLRALNAWRAQCPDDADLVFPSPCGGRFDNVNSAWKAVLKGANVIKFRWHDMRHTFASRLVMKGVDLNTVRVLLGHADIQMTLRYAHLAPEHMADAVAKLVPAA